VCSDNAVGQITHKHAPFRLLDPHRAPATYPLEVSAPNKDMKSAPSTRSTLPLRPAVRSACLFLCMLLFASLHCYASAIVLIRSTKSPSAEQHELELAARFYGVDLNVVTLGPDTVPALRTGIENHATQAVAIEASALSRINREALLEALRRGTAQSVPLLLLGVTPETDKQLLEAWSGNVVTGAESISSSSPLRYEVGHVEGLTQELTGLEIPFAGSSTIHFDTGSLQNAQVILEVRGDQQQVPTFVESDQGPQKIFLLCSRSHPAGSAFGLAADNLEGAFEQLAPAMMFVKFTMGERAWHSLARYANLTIDDPWLHEPYGNLNYHALVQEMQNHKFHTTIAFIPWNYDRSQPELVSLFRQNPALLSICVHGDNHDHQEFADFQSKTLDAQVAAVRQSIARMNEFQSLTGIPYDRVMVFPHRIGEEKTLEALKANNFLATINSENVPMGATRPNDPLFAMRPETLAFGDFPTILRDSVEAPAPRYRIAISEFLGNPLLFYGHQEFFARGTGAFNGVADEVNEIEPGIRWSGVGDLVKHLYLVRLREDAGYDVLALSSNLQLDNSTGRDAVFHVQRQEPEADAVGAVLVDGGPVPFQLKDGSLDVILPLSAGQSRTLVIQYKNDTVASPLDVGHGALRVYVLRTISDFRDLTLSHFVSGRIITRAYNAGRWTLSGLILDGLGAVATLFCVAWAILRIAGRRKPSGPSVRGLPNGTDGRGTMNASNGPGGPAPGQLMQSRRPDGAFTLITAAYNEEAYIENTIRAVAGQSVRPVKWIIASDGSTDRTDAIVSQYARENDFIELVRIDASHKGNFSAKVQAIRTASDHLAGLEYEFIGILDADITLDSDYYARLFEMFKRDPKLGIAGGRIYEEKAGAFQDRMGNRTRSVPGAVQLFRRQCYESIGGIRPLAHGGEDWFAEVRARMHGWVVKSDQDLIAYHHRPTGTADNLVRRWFQQGRMDFSLGSLPTFEFVKCCLRMWQKPLVIGGLARLAGFLWSYWVREDRGVSEDVVQFLRSEQRQRLTAMAFRQAADE